MSATSPIRWPAEAVWEAVSPSLPGFTVEVLPSIDSTNTELGSLDDALGFLGQLTQHTPRMIADVGCAAEEIHKRVCEFAA